MTRTNLVWLGVAAFVLIVLGANAHLAYVAFASQPACVAHVKAGAAPSTTDFAAAKSSC